MWRASTQHHGSGATTSTCKWGAPWRCTFGAGFSLCLTVIILHMPSLGSVEASPMNGEAGTILGCTCLHCQDISACSKPELQWGRCFQSVCTSLPRAGPSAGMHVMEISACSQPKVRWGDVKKSGKSHTGSRTAARIGEALQVEITVMDHDKGDNSTSPNCRRLVKRRLHE